jgi:hypothetical protein
MQFTGRTRAALTSVALLAALGAVTLSAPGPATAASSPGGTWGPSQPVPGLAALLPAGSTLDTYNSGVNGLSCASPGNCVLVGHLTPTVAATSVASRALFIASEANGIVGTPELIPGLADLGSINDTSYLQAVCAAVGECTVSGGVTDAQGNEHPFLVTATDGTWGQATTVDTSALRTPAADITKLSCMAPGECTAVGFAALSNGHSLAFTLDETGGAWGTPQALPVSASVVSARPESLSCSSPGNCTVAGDYTDTSDRLAHSFVAAEVNGTWSSLQGIPGLDSLNTGNGGGTISVSCPVTADCTVVGLYKDSAFTLRTFVDDEVGGTWGPARELLLPAGKQISTSLAPQLACWSAGNCTATGADLSSSAAMSHAFVASEVNGTWGAGASLASIPDTEPSSGTTVSCTAGGTCVVAGFYVASYDQPFAATVSNGSAGPAQAVVLRNTVYPTIALSCPQAGYCTVAASSGWNLPALANEASASSTTLQASTTSLVYGNEQSEVLTMKVTSPAGGTPTGSITVNGGGATPLCTMALANGTATCSLTPTALPAWTLLPGSPFATLTATYSGDVNYVGSASTPVSLIVHGIPPTMTLKVSPAAQPYHSNSATFTYSVTMTSSFGTPTGAVDIYLLTPNGSLLCEAVLTGGKSSCTTTGTRGIGGPGRYQVDAQYLGDGIHEPSHSAPVTLTITKPTTTAFTLSRTSVAYGQENLEKLSVKVSSALGGTPAGTVTIKAGTTVLCTIALSKGTGSCTLSATRLRPGNYSLLARYGGNASYAPSSVTRGLTVTS